MKHCISFIFACLLLAFPASLFAENGMMLELTNGQTVGFAFKDKPKITVGPTLVIESGDGTQVEYAYSDVRKFYWGDASSATGIGRTLSPSKGNVVFHTTSDGISVEGLQKGVRVSVCTLDGRQVVSAVSSSDEGRVVLPLDGKKLFVVRTSNGISYKIMKN